MGLCGASHVIKKNKNDLSRTNETNITNINDSKSDLQNDINKNKIKNNKFEINFKARIGEKELPIFLESKSKIEINILPGELSAWSFLPNEELTDFRGHKNYQYRNMNIGCLLARISSSKNFININKNKIKFTVSEPGSLLLSANLDPNNYSLYKPKGSIRLIMIGVNNIGKNKVDELTGYKYIDYDKINKEKCFNDLFLEISRYINKARTNIKKYINDFILDFNDKEFNFEEIKDLPLLTIDNKLFEIAEDHCIYLSTNGTSGHIGKNNMKNESDNIKNENYTECIIYGLKNPILIVNFLIIDKYSKNKENRKNIFNPKFTRIGISILEHISYGYCCVIILG